MRINARTKSCLVLVLVCAAFFAPPRTSAATLSEYRNSLSETHDAVLELEEYLSSSETYDRAHEKELIGNVRSQLQPTQRIEIPGGAVETANQWLGERLDVLEAEEDPNKRAAAIAEVRERLTALIGAVDELQAASEGPQSKDQTKQKVGEILRRPEFAQPAQPSESAVEKWLREFLEWLESLMPSPPPAGTPSGGMRSLAWGLQIALFALIAGILIFGIYKLAPVIFPKLKREQKPKREDRVIMGEKIAYDESSKDLFEDAEKLAKNGDTRGAIRKGYIALLCELSDRRVIGLARHKTNRDYLRDVRKQRAVHAGLAGATESFERHWYGFGDTRPEDWEAFRSGCRETITKI